MTQQREFRQLLDEAQPIPGGLGFEVSEDWLQGRTTFGGLQAAMAVRAMRTLVPAEVPLRVLQTTFVGPVPGGPVSVTVSLLRSGKSVSHVEARLRSGEDICCVAVGVFGKARESALQIAAREYPVLPEPASLKELPFVSGVTPSFTRHYRFLWAEGSWPFSGAARPKTGIYLQQRSGPVTTELEAIAMADTIPSPGISMLKKPTPASSLTWTLEFLQTDFADSGDGYWLMDAEVTDGADGYFCQTAVLWNAARKVCALSRQSVTIFG